MNCEEINAASTITALIYSGLFNLTKTYFLVAGIAGINPHVATTGSVTFSRYAVQFDLQYEFDSRQIPSKDTSGYFPQNGKFLCPYNQSTLARFSDFSLSRQFLGSLRNLAGFAARCLLFLCLC
jgi:purine nucleoside permease